MRDWQALTTYFCLSVTGDGKLCGRAYEEVLGVDLAMLGEVEILLRDEHALAEQILVDLLAVLLGDQPVQLLAMCGNVVGAIALHLAGGDVVSCGSMRICWRKFKVRKVGLKYLRAPKA